MNFVQSGTIGLLLLFAQSGFAANSLPEDYQTRTAAEKQELLWEQIEQTPWSQLPAYNSNDWGSILKNIRALFSLNVTFDHASDEIPEGRVKFIHTYGSVVKFTFEPEQGHPFTGMYQTGGRGIARLSLAANPDVVGFTPGMAVKFLVNESPSLNLVVMNSLEGQEPNRNFFAKDFSNKIDEPTSRTLWMLGKVFELARKPATDLPVNHIAAVHENGQQVHTVHAPGRLIFKPSQDVSSLIPVDSSEDVRESFLHIPAGAVLYEVYGTSGEREIFIGRLRTLSGFISSSYGDKKLFFQHRR